MEIFGHSNALFKSIKQDWQTPPELYDELNKEFSFDFDPCPVNPQFDGLNVEWGKSNFVNPPYCDLKKWIKKGYDEYRKGKTVVFLIPARTDTKAFHDYLYHTAEIRFIKGRLRFVGAKENAPFPSMICILRSPPKIKVQYVHSVAEIPSDNADAWVRLQLIGQEDIEYMIRHNELVKR